MIHRADREQTTALYRPALQFLFANKDGETTFDALRSTIALVQRERIALDLYLTPHHARAYELIRAIGLWPKYRAWLRELAAIADTTGACILDFGSYSDLTTDTMAATVAFTVTSGRWQVSAMMSWHRLLPHRFSGETSATRR